MKNLSEELIRNGSFIDGKLAPWTTNIETSPVFTPYKHGEKGAHSLLIPESSESITQLIEGHSFPAQFKVNWEVTARVKSKAHSGTGLFFLITTRVGTEYYLDSAYTPDLTDEWKTFEFFGVSTFPGVNEGLYIQALNARKVTADGAFSAPMELTNLKMSFQKA